MHKGLNILTNTEDNGRIHLLNKFGPFEPMDANLFASKARETILDIHARRKVAIVEGGSTFYLKHLFEGQVD